MRIAVGADHAGYKVKEAVKKSLRKAGHEVIDCGTDTKDSVDYPDYARKVSRLVSKGECDRGVLICGSGQGMAMTANKTKNVRAALCWNRSSAVLSRQHNDANVFCSGARLVPLRDIMDCLRIWLKTDFEGGRHSIRVRKIEGSESRHS